MNVAETMRDLLPEIKKGIDCVRFVDLTPECEGDWNENYAIVQGLVPSFTIDRSETEYFDQDKLFFDFESNVKAMFPGCEVKFYWKSQEIEVVRK